jgi:hypothetical protein
LTLQHAAVANQRQQVIPDRERAIVAGGHEPQGHARLYHDFELCRQPVRAAASSAAASKRSRATPLSWPGAGRSYEEIAAGREAAAA